MLTQPPITPPKKPGCYIYKDKKGNPIYVGKAKNLRARVSSYFKSGEVPPKIVKMLESAESIEYMVVNNELEAFLLENTLIKRFKPKFNILLRDDKTYPYLKIPIQDEYPKAMLARRNLNDGALYFGPFVPGSQVRFLLRFLQRHFHLATCKDPLNQTRKTPCLYYHLHVCDAPCVKGFIAKEEYGKIVSKAILFLKGKEGELSKSIEQEMKEASERMNYERAAYLRDLLNAVDDVNKRQVVVNSDKKNMDVFALAGENGRYLIYINQVISGRLAGKKAFFFNDVEISENDLLPYLISQYYSDVEPPDKILLSAQVSCLSTLREYLEKKGGRKVKILNPRKGLNAMLLKNTIENARIEFESRYNLNNALFEIADILHLREPVKRIECFDISHTGGKETTASMVVWEGTMKKSGYRKFIIRGLDKIDDFAAMEQVVLRRYKRLIEENKPLPSLILVDGGAGQVSSALKAVSSLDIGIPIAGLAKKREEIFIAKKEKPVILSKSSRSLQLLQEIRDEAHRFAVTFHRKRRGKAFLNDE